jgi:hypothetical protein
MVDDVRRAFGVRRDRRAGMLGLELQQLGFAENAWWTMQMPGHSSMSRPVLRAR